MEDNQLVLSCLNGDQKACNELFKRFAPGMLSLCHRYLKNSAEAEDALQDGFIKVFQNLKNWNGTGPIAAWIRKIIINTCITKLNSSYQLLTQFSGEGIPELQIDPSVISQLNYENLLELLKAMPIGYRTVFNLVVIECYSYKEISSMLHIQESSCRSQLLKAKNYLAQKITNHYPELKLKYEAKLD